MNSTACAKRFELHKNLLIGLIKLQIRGLCHIYYEIVIKTT